ncbi:MAG: hypothetical protein ACRDSF_00040 [Pseudonocardiaceae bacterium]
MIYLASDYNHQWEMKKKRADIEGRGYTVISCWIDSPQRAAGIGGVGISDDNLAEYELCAIRDLADLDQCSEFVMFSTGELSRGGRHTEYGYALGKKMLIHLVGPREHTFHCLPSPFMTHYPTWELFLYMLDQRNTIPFPMSFR